ncbi:hypothetical protein P3T73_05385 [Kiritimatiellota bacterium B12222]|nr:hypothetical protein P3T73_05385 [Kiritimatiellota bacterium B12222]
MKYGRFFLQLSLCAAWVCLSACHSVKVSHAEMETAFFPIRSPLNGDEVNFFVKQCNSPMVETLHFEESVGTVVVVAESAFIENLRHEIELQAQEDCFCN